MRRSTPGTNLSSPRPAARVRLSRPARRAQLLVAASEVFARQGYHAAAMDEIAERAGVSKPVLYQHFPSKLHLYLALLDHHTEGLVSAVRSALASTTDNHERVRASITAYFDFVDGADHAYRLVFENDLRSEPAVRERVELALQRCVDAIADTIAGDTGVGGAEAQLLSVGLAGLAEVSARWWLTAGGPGTAEHAVAEGVDGTAETRQLSKQRAVDLLVSLAWRGLSGTPAPADL